VIPQTVDVRPETLEYPTYAMSPPSPYPGYGWARRRGCYPRAILSDLCDECRPGTHRARGAVTLPAALSAGIFDQEKPISTSTDQ